ncbi:hypothetical protein CRENBAI_020842 [Crenichthys baileyi]|uniref:Cilia- and flagella-associated protein 69 ARM repeats domain-containing protein n=1 Tax=Crenichthys baileyi TaxID=28760 RepID=A0AAV9S9X2_9TELE
MLVVSPGIDHQQVQRGFVEPSGPEPFQFEPLAEGADSVMPEATTGASLSTAGWRLLLQTSNCRQTERIRAPSLPGRDQIKSLSCIVGCCFTEYQFLAKEGASLLLDLLQASPRCIHSFILATLLDLCNNPNTRPQILSWRDVSGQTAPRVLLQLWREEEEELGVLRNQHGGIKDPEKPLLTGFQEDSSGLSLPADTPYAAVLATSENLRAKIYLLFCSLGFQELPGLSAGDHVTLGIVRRYLDFKVGEVWNEICSELILDGVKPIRSDQEALRSICKTSEETARKLMEDQTRILEEQEEEEIREEMLIYKEMKSRQKQQEIEAKSWDRYISRTSNYNILKEEKAQRKNYMESNLKHENAAADRPAKLFISHILAVENTGDQGPAGVDVTLARTSV